MPMQTQTQQPQLQPNQSQSSVRRRSQHHWQRQGPRQVGLDYYGLLVQVLPKPCADKLLLGEDPELEPMDGVGVLCAVLTGWETAVEVSHPAAAGVFLNRFVRVVESLGNPAGVRVEMLQEGSFMAAIGLDARAGSTQSLVKLAISLRDELWSLKASMPTPLGDNVNISIGIDYGRAALAVLGRLSPRCQLLGTAPRTARQLCEMASAVPGSMLVSAATVMQLRPSPEGVLPALGNMRAAPVQVTGSSALPCHALLKPGESLISPWPTTLRVVTAPLQASSIGGTACSSSPARNTNGHINAAQHDELVQLREFTNVLQRQNAHLRLEVSQLERRITEAEPNILRLGYMKEAAEAEATSSTAKARHLEVDLDFFRNLNTKGCAACGPLTTNGSLHP